MRRSSWTPSIVPNDNDETIYLVADDFGRLGRAWREVDYEATDLETVIQEAPTRPSLVVGFPMGDRPLIGIYEGRCRLPENIAIS
jgi:hypothetical protein